jgi:CBS domain-containing protein
MFYLQLNKRETQSCLHVALILYITGFSPLQVNEDQPVLKAFQLMREKGVGGLPVMDTSGTKAIGNISIRDVQYLLAAPKIYKQYRFVTLMHTSC